MNFKYFIIAIYLVFVALIVTMVFKSCGQNIDLETKNYYAEELQYQTKIDALKKGNQYADSFVVYEDAGMIKVKQAKSLLCDSIKLVFKKPDNAKADRSFVFKGSVIEPILKSNFVPGVYGLNIYLYSNGVYQIEKKIKL